MLPDETTILNFRRLLETHGLTDKLFALVRELLESKGLLLKFGTLVDATLIAAPPSIKNADGKRDPQMTQTKKGNTWHFGMKVHVGADSRSGLIHYDYPCVHQAIARLGALDGVAIRRTAGVEQTEAEALFNRVVAKIRSHVEHPFRVLKRQFGYTTVRYRGLAKNTSQIARLFAPINSYMGKRRLMPNGA